MAGAIKVNFKEHDEKAHKEDVPKSPGKEDMHKAVGALKVGDEHTQGPPKDIFEAAERGMVGYIVRQVERSLEFDINMRDKNQRTALHWAAELNHVEVAEALIDYGIDPFATECNGRTAVHLAAREGHAQILQVITSEMTDSQRETIVNQRDIHGITPVYLALQRGDENRAAFEYLMKCGAKYNQQTNTLRSQHSAATQGADGSHGDGDPM